MMSILRALLIAAISVPFLTGADHTDAPILILHDTDKVAHEYEVLSWSWEKGEGLKGALPGSSNAVHVSLAENNDFRQFNDWYVSQAVLPKMLFETAKCGDVLHFTLKNLTIKSVEQSARALDVTMRFERVTIEGDEGVIKACLD